MIGLNLRQKPPRAAAAAAPYASQITRTKGICRVTDANATGEETNFSTCRSAATVRCLSRTAPRISRGPLGLYGGNWAEQMCDCAVICGSENSRKYRRAGAKIESGSVMPRTRSRKGRIR